MRIHHTVPETIQTKLTKGQPEDKYEEEADRMADAMMRMLNLVRAFEN
jgi:hypothetical protein